jgi:hypothetical protein
MRTAEEILRTTEKHKDKIRRFGVRRLALIGSFARGEQTEESDLDFLVEFDTKTFDSFMELIFFLEDLFGCSVDVLIADSLRERVRSSIMKEAIYVPGL